VVKFWITKYALTGGIQEVEAETFANSPNMIACRSKFGSFYCHRPHWHASHEEACAQAEAMRVAKIASLRKSITKLEKKAFAMLPGKVT